MKADRDEDYHALLSPSSAHTWLACPPAIALGMTQPRKDSQYSREGTSAHTLAADCLTMDFDPTDFIGTHVEGKGEMFDVTPEFAEAVQVYVDLVRSRVADYERLGYFVQVEVEQQVPIGHITGEEGARGTSDVVILALSGDDRPNIIEVIDLKFGQGVVVQAEDNPQGMLYALGAIEKFGKVNTFDEVRITISQPRIRPEPSEWTISAKELDEASAYKFEPAAVMALEFVGKTKFDLEQFNPGEKQCKFCNGKAVCPGFKRYTEDAMSAEFDFIDADLESPAEKAYVTALTNEELAAIFPKLPVIEQFIKAVYGRVSELALSGEDLPGIKVVRGKKGNRAWDNPDEVEAELKAMRVKQDQMYKFSLLSPSALEKTLAEKMPRNWKKLAARITQSEGSLTVVADTDPRQAVEVKPLSSQFEELE